MTDDEVVRQQLIALLRGGNAHLNFERAVSQFPLDYINRKVSSISYSPWELLEHMRICQWDILEFIRNPQYKSPPWPKGYWPAKGESADENKWKKTLSNFRADLSSAENLLGDSSTGKTRGRFFVSYSGDFREHGRKQKAFQWFLKHVPENVDVLLLEGTVLHRGLKGKGAGEFNSETEIEDETVRLLEASKKKTLLYFSA